MKEISRVSHHEPVNPRPPLVSTNPLEMKELEELKRLEKKSDITQILRTDPVIAQSDGTLLHWLSNIMLHASKSQDAIRRWRALKKRGNRTSADFSPIQRAVLTLPDEQIGTLFDQTQGYLIYTAPGVGDKMQNRISGDHGHRWNDEYEQRQRPKRSLAQLREHGIIISVNPQDIELIRQTSTKDAVCTILDKVKNKRIISINGFSDSKASLSIHDTFDHFWTYDLLDRTGILDRYHSFLQSVGNPQDTDIFSREGELAASMSFEWRASHTPERNFKPLLAFSQIQRILEKTIPTTKTDNQKRAEKILTSLDPQGEEATRLSSGYSGILIEFMEQRRKYGFIRKLDQNYQPIGNLSLLDPEYLALVIEINHLLADPTTQTKNALFNIEALVEDYLLALAQNETTKDLSIKLEDIRTFDPTTSRISPARQEWLRNNPFHTATRRDRCDDE